MPILDDIARILHDENFLVTEIRPGILYVKMSSHARIGGVSVCLIEPKANEVVIYAHVDSVSASKVIEAIKANMILNVIPKLPLTITELPVNDKRNEIFVTYYEEILISP